MKRYRTAADIRVGVVGYGPTCNIARHHIGEMKRIGLTPVAVADIDPTRLPLARQDWPDIRTFDSATEMLANCELDLVTLCTPHNTHTPLALECLAAGKHVITEKPFAVTTDDCDRMIALARQQDVMLSTYHNRHWDGCVVQAVRKIRDEKLIGDVLRIEAHLGGYHRPGPQWRSSKSISGGILYDWGVHLLEYSLQVLDAEILEVSGYARTGFWAAQSPWGDDTIEDEASASVRFSGQKLLNLRLSHVEANPRWDWLEITGTHGSYLFDHARWEAIVREPGGATAHFDGPNPATEWWRFYANIAAHLTKGEELIIKPEYARRPIHVLDLAGKSARSGGAIPGWYR